MDRELLAWLIASGQATADDLRGADASFVRDCKLAAGVQVRSHALPVQDAAKAAGGDDGESRKITYIASTEDQDRMGDIIRVYGGGGAKGWQLANFKANPVGLWCHDTWGPPIASVRAWRERGYMQGGTAKPVLLSEFDYHTADENPAAEVAYKLARKGALRAVSVGFRPLKWAEHNSPEERAAAGLGPYGVEFTEQDLHEISNCAVPANPFALVVGLKSLVDAGQLTTRDADAFARQYPLTEDELVQRLRARVRSVVDMGRATGGDQAERADASAPPAPVPQPPHQPPVLGTEVRTDAPPADPAPQAPQVPQVELRVVVRGTSVVADAVACLLARGEAAFRAAGAGPAAGAGACYTLDYADHDEWGGLDPATGDALRNAIPQATRAAARSALAGACDQLAAAQDALAAVIDAMGDDNPTPEELAAVADAGKAAPSPADMLALVEQVRTLVRTMEHRSGGNGGAPAPQAVPETAVDVALDTPEARDLITRMTQIAGGNRR